MAAVTYSLIVPVYKNEDFIELLLAACRKIDDRLCGSLEVVFVVDGSPDRCFEMLSQQLPEQPFASQLIAHSRNFGSFAAIRSGLLVADGEYFATMSADLQEPPELVCEFFETLKTHEYDVVVGTRDRREEVWLAGKLSQAYWWLYRKLIMSSMPEGGVDMFGGNQQFRRELLQLQENHTSLVGLVYWLGFRRKEIPYRRLPRLFGKGAWTLTKKFNYFFDSVFAFSDLPIKLLIGFGALGLLFSFAFGSIVFLLRVFMGTEVSGYSATIMTILFFGALNSMGLGIIGSYVWRAYGNVQGRPGSVVMHHRRYDHQANIERQH